MKPFIFSLIIVCSNFASMFSQDYSARGPENQYRSVNNPNYWKNKLPFSDYWQQDVHYSISANIDEATDIITATEKLTYWNNSPNNLDFVFFHLYQQAFQPNSYYDKLHKSNRKGTYFGRYEREGKGTEITSLKINGEDVKVEYDNTIFKVYLPTPLKPGASVVFDIDFKTYFDQGSMRRRMKTFRSSGYKHYDGVHWYPRISVYDRKFGWTTDQHLGREFYGDFGTFDVELTFSSNYIVDATGYLINKEEVLPDTLREKIDISNFKDKPWGEKASEIIAYDPTKRKTWKFHAENVHDFAFTADPTYRIGETYWNGIQCVALVQEPHASKWQNASDYVSKVIKTFSEDIGMYTYNKMIAADANDGMEYPMLTLDRGQDPTFRGLFVHEIGHNWFFGQVGTNETYRAFMDEGFTQFLTAWGLEKIDGDTIPYNKSSSEYKNWFFKPNLVRERNAYYGYLRDAMKGEDAYLNTHSDDFGGAIRHGGGYGHVYYKTATMLYNLQYVLGDELFLKALQNYFNTWKIAHPYPEDFRNSIIQFTGVDLNWFFDQWFETNKNIDFSIESTKKGSAENQYTINFSRLGEMQMPLDFSVYAKDGKVYNYHIPNTWFNKETDATILDRWIGWGKLNNTYAANVNVPSGIYDVKIDTTGRLADINLMNNKLKNKVSLEFDHKIRNPIDREHYELRVRPDFWYNAYDGIKSGVHFSGDYMKYKHRFNLTAWLNTGLLQQDIFLPSEKSSFNLFSYRADYTTPVNAIFHGAEVTIASKYLDGLVANRLGIAIPSKNKKTVFSAYFKSMYRPNITDLNYLWYPLEWNHNTWNNTFNVKLDHSYQHLNGVGKVQLSARLSGLGSQYDFSTISIESINKNDLGNINFNTRFFAQYGFGSNWAPESQLYLAGGNPEDMMDSKYFRSIGFFDNGWSGHGIDVNNLHYGGGLNLRGYSGYLASETLDSTGLSLVYKGESGASVNMELEFQELLPRIRSLSKVLSFKTYLFGDIGVIDENNTINNKLKLASVRIDAGVGTALTIKKFGPLETVEPLIIRADFPLFLNRLPAVQNDYLDFRWVLSIGRAF